MARTSERRLAQNRAWREANRDAVNARRNARLAADPVRRAKNAQRHQQWYGENKPRVKANARAWKKKNPTRVAASERNGRLKRDYGITSADYDMLYQQQGGRCRICNKRKPKLHVDHCHKSQRVRGLLCHKCNVGLGMFEDRVSALNAAIAYLTEG